VKQYTTANAKQKLSILLDAAERGESVIIERRGVRFRVQREGHTSRKRTSGRPVIEIVDPAIAQGQWQWQWKANGLHFSKRQRENR